MEKTQNVRKTSKLKEKTQNSSKKLMVWEALAPYVSPSDVKKRACCKNASRLEEMVLAGIQSPESDCQMIILVTCAGLNF